MSSTQSRRLARTFVGISLLVVIGAGFSAVGNASDTVIHSAHSGYVSIVVAPGETLWSIAGMVGGSDTASVVDQIVSANSLTSSDVHSGMKLWVPAK